MTRGFQRPGALPADDGGDPYIQWDAAYVVGSLSSTERREYESHLNICASCRAAVAELSGMPALLGLFGRDEMAAMTVDDDTWPAVPPPLRPEVLDSLLAKVSWRRRRARFLTIAVSTVAAAVLTLGVFVALRPGPASPELPPQASVGVVTLAPVADSQLDASVTLSSRGWGTHIDMTCTYSESPGEPADAGDKLAMVAVGRDGTHTQLATWMSLAGATAFPSGSTFMPIDEIVAVQVVSADTGNVLLQRNL